MNTAKASPAHVIVADLHRRITGVSTTIRSLLPLMRDRINLAFLANTPQGDIPNITLREAWKICRSPLPAGLPFRIWHARRNNEMLWGLIFKHLFRCKLKLVFTSAAKRRHSWYPRQLIRLMDAIIATSEVAASFVPQAVQVVPHGVDTKRFVACEDKQDVKQELGFKSKYAIGIIGRVRPEKGTDLFVNSLCPLLNEYKQFDAYVIGLTTRQFSGFEQDLRQTIAAAGLEDRFHWLGPVPIEKMPRYQRALDLTVAPARYEGFGMVPLEAMACGNAVVASDTGAYRDMIAEGESGFLVPTDDLPALRNALQKILEKPALLESFGACGLHRAAEQFSAQKEVDSILDVYRQVWNNQGAQP
jgi:mannosyltransferase